VKEPRYCSIERRFFRLISQPQPLAEAAGALPLASWIRAPDDQAAALRLGIYQHMYFARLRDSLREDFELLARLVPSRVFDRIAASYLEHHPSENPSLRYHGRYFPQFLQYSLQEHAAITRELRPDAGDLACLEWARIDAFDAPSSTPLRREDLLDLARNGQSELSLRCHPSVQLLETRFRVSALWQAVESDQTHPGPAPGPELVLVWRRGFRVYHRGVSEQEAAAVRRLREGATLQALCECFTRPASSAEEDAQRAFATLDQWLMDELVVVDASI